MLHFQMHKKTLFEDAIRSHEKLQPQIQQSRVMQETVARMTGATSADMGFNVFHEFVLNQAKEIDNAEAKTKVCKALKTKVNQHQQGRRKSGKGKECEPPAWKSDPNLADFKSMIFPKDEWKNKTKEDRQIHWGKEKTRQEKHKKQKETEHARQQMPWQANSHNLVDRGANGVIACEIIPDEDDTTAAESQTEIPSDDPGGQVAHLLSTTHAKKSQVWKALVHEGKTWHLGKHIRHKVSQHERSTHGDSLVDRGANGGFATPKDMELMAISATQKVDVAGIDNHTCSDMPVATAASVITTLNQGPCIGIFNQCAWNEDGEAGHTIHSPL